MGDATYRQIGRKREELEQHFAPQSDRFHVENIISHGGWGVALLVTEYRPAGPLPAIPPEPGPRGIKRLRSITPTGIAMAIRDTYRTFKRRRLASRGSEPAALSDPPAFARSPSPPERTVLRRLCVKMPYRKVAEDALRNEIETLRTVNGGMHVVGIVAYRDDPEARAKVLARRPFPRVAAGQGDYLAGLAGPILVMEYLENGTIGSLIRRLQESDTIVPNRILWAFYLCGIRACLALAYPKALDPDATAILEGIPPPGIQASGLDHRDIHTANVLIGNIDPAVAEHSHVPILKLIDFGEAVDEDPPEDAMSYNLCAISEIMLCLIIRKPRTYDIPGSRIGMWQGIRTTAKELSDTLDLANPVDPYRHVDIELRDLICRSMATDWDLRTPLAVAFDTAIRAVTTKTAASFSLYETAETDDDIRQFVQKLILNPGEATLEESVPFNLSLGSPG
ncbi:hypothetical protein F5Y19DRAFT_412301 [Xylariaceae sp. FL1651]|nr:hypothetical protein F5Y19DRAFT_412301 [Xylariaceae sp. FL1651]